MPRNPIILRAPFCLFLGAGASAPLGLPTMEPFIDGMLTELQKTPLRTETGTLNVLTKASGKDLEVIFDELESIISRDYAHSISGTLKGLGPFVILRDDAETLRNAIEHRVIKTYRSVNAKSVVELYDPLMDRIFSSIDENQYCLPVFSTNYDTAIECFCAERHDKYEITDGFLFDTARRNSYWFESAFEQFCLTPSKRNIVLFKMHGSVDWMSETASNRIVRSAAMYDILDSDAFSNVLIYPATRKVAVDNPFYVAYDYLQRCLENSRACLTIGYSFRDYDALTRVRSAAGQNVNLWVALLSPFAKDVLSQVPISDSQKISLERPFGISNVWHDPVEDLLRKVMK